MDPLSHLGSVLPTTALFVACLIDHACVNFLVSHFNFFFFFFLHYDKTRTEERTTPDISIVIQPFIIRCVLLRVSQHSGIQGILPSSHTNRTGKVLP